MATDYYKLLGVPKNASEREIRAGYRRLARKFHPDVNPGNDQAESKFRDVNEAYQVLSDPETRRNYDRFGAGWREAHQAQKGNRPRRSTTDSGAGPDLSDLLGDLGGLFGRPGGRGRRVTVEETLGIQQVEVSVRASLQEAYQGTKRMVQAPNHPLTGQAGRRFEVAIPRGVDTGTRVHVGGSRGSGLDLTVVMNVAQHKLFERRGNDLAVTLDVPLTAAVLGGEAEVPTIQGGRVALKIPPQTQNGRIFRLRGKGMPKRGSPEYGDLLATVKVVLPADLSAEETELFERLRAMRVEITQPQEDKE